MLQDGLRILYLHGFASSPGSRKARFFSEQLHQAGFQVEILDLAEGDFEGLTITRQLRLVERAARGKPVTLIGSSLGGYLAALYATCHPEVDRLILLAPAFQFYRLWVSQLSQDQLLLWRQTGSLLVFHYGENREMPLGFGFMEDASRFPAYPGFRQPALIFHGDHDPVVPVTQSIGFVQSHPHTRLVRLQSGHELTDVLDTIWNESREFLLGSTPVKSN
jgi:uncharacterized protein